MFFAQGHNMMTPVGKKGLYYPSSAAKASSKNKGAAVTAFFLMGNNSILS